MEQPSIFIQVPESAHPDTYELLSELLMILPNSYKLEVDTQPSDIDIIVKIHEDIKPQFLIFSSGEFQFVFKLIEYRSRKSIGVESQIKKENHQLVLTRFVSDVGLKVAGLFMFLFPINLESNQVVNFLVHKDFIFFRMYRTCLTEKGPVFEKLGPHLTMRLWRITDIKGGEKTIHNYKKYVKNANIL
ncbi:Ribosome production factor 1 [Glugoides intestinalis]